MRCASAMQYAALASAQAGLGWERRTSAAAAAASSAGGRRWPHTARGAARMSAPLALLSMHCRAARACVVGAGGGQRSGFKEPRWPAVAIPTLIIATGLGQRCERGRDVGAVRLREGRRHAPPIGIPSHPSREPPTGPSACLHALRQRGAAAAAAGLGPAPTVCLQWDAERCHAGCAAAKGPGFVPVAVLAGH